MRYGKSIILTVIFFIVIVMSTKNSWESILKTPQKYKAEEMTDDKSKTDEKSRSDEIMNPPENNGSAPQPDLEIKRFVADVDKDRDGIKDADDIIQGARKQVELMPRYVSEYYKGGYPPENIAVCTDVVCRAFMNAGYDLKSMMDKDIAADTRSYPRVGGKPDPNIDFRRVRNMVPFFKKYAQSLTTEIIPDDVNNLYKWQGGDLVVFYWTGIEHIAVVSDKRNAEGIPYLIHTYGSYPKEDDRLLDWADTIAFHFRYPAAGGKTKDPG